MWYVSEYWYTNVTYSLLSLFGISIRCTLDRHYLPCALVCLYECIQVPVQTRKHSYHIYIYTHTVGFGWRKLFFWYCLYFRFIRSFVGLSKVWYSVLTNVQVIWIEHLKESSRWFCLPLTLPPLPPLLSLLLMTTMMTVCVCACVRLLSVQA